MCELIDAKGSDSGRERQAWIGKGTEAVDEANDVMTGVKKDGFRMAAEHTLLFSGTHSAACLKAFIIRLRELVESRTLEPLTGVFFRHK